MYRQSFMKVIDNSCISLGIAFSQISQLFDETSDIGYIRIANTLHIL